MMTLIRTLVILLRLGVNAVFWLLGQILVRWQANKVHRRTSQKMARTVSAFDAQWMWPWGNEEDGVDGMPGDVRNDILLESQRWWIDRKFSSRRARIIAWSANRNPQNNLRYVPVLSPRFYSEAMRVHTWGDGNFYVTMGVYSSLLLHLKVRGHEFRFWIGWKLKPGDEKGVPANDTRLPRADFALQFKRWKP